jgi:ABC-2 type transport system ATP-binding protein
VTIPDPAVELVGLTKAFGTQLALDGVDLRVPEGSVFGFLGPNGAGKTTTLRIITGLARPTRGRALVLGRDATAADAGLRSVIGFLPDVPGFYPWMTGEEFLHFVGRLFGLEATLIRDRTNHLLDSAGLLGVHTRIGGYSRGMKQRLGIAQALMNAPRLLLLDEPTSALDPLGRKEVLEMIDALRGRTTVFFSSHILADVERVCDAVAILNKGKLIVQSAIADLKAGAGIHHISVEVEGDVASLASSLRPAPWVHDVTQNGSLVRLSITDLQAALQTIPETIVSMGLGLRRFEVEEQSIEDIFVTLIGRDSS